jgi:hypothetical protein
MNRNNTNYTINKINSSRIPNVKIVDKNVNYKMTNNVIHENYWFQDLSGTIFNLNYALKIFPESSMTYPEKINTLVRLSIYIGLILGLFYSNYLFLYIPIITMALTYLLYVFRLEQLESTRAQQGPNAKLNTITNKQLNTLKDKNISQFGNVRMGGKGIDAVEGYGPRNGSSGYGNMDLLDNINIEEGDFKAMLNIKTCSKPNANNPFMNPLVFDSRTRDMSCDSVKPEIQNQIETEYNKYCIKDISDIYNHNSGRRQFYTVASTTYPNNQGAFANWLYKTPPTCKEGNGAQCVANYYTPLNSSLMTPGYGSKA